MPGDPLAGMRFIFFALGGALGLVGLSIAVWRIGDLRARRRVAGEVLSFALGMSRRTSSGTSRSSTVKFRFTTADGDTVDASDTNSMGTFHEGQAVTVYYNVADPSDAIVATLYRFWFLPALFIGLGSMFAVIAATV
jgi:hypothetical protein